MRALLIDRVSQLVGVIFQIAELMGLFEKKKTYEEDQQRSWVIPVDPKLDPKVLEMNGAKR